MAEDVAVHTNVENFETQESFAPRRVQMPDANCSESSNLTSQPEYSDLPRHGHIEHVNDDEHDHEDMDNNEVELLDDCFEADSSGTNDDDAKSEHFQAKWDALSESEVKDEEKDIQSDINSHDAFIPQNNDIKDMDDNEDNTPVFDENRSKGADDVISIPTQSSVPSVHRNSSSSSEIQKPVAPLSVPRRSSVPSIHRNSSSSSDTQKQVTPGQGERRESVGRFTITPVSQKKIIKSQVTPTSSLDSKSEQESLPGSIIHNGEIMIRLEPPPEDKKNRNNSNSKSVSFGFCEDNSPAIFYMDDELTDGHYDFDNHGFHPDEVDAEPSMTKNLKPNRFLRSHSMGTLEHLRGNMSKITKINMDRRASEHVIGKSVPGLYTARDSVRITKHNLSHKPYYMRYEEAEAVLERKQAMEESMIKRTVEPKSNDYLAFACAVTLCCNPIVGIVALYFSVSSNYCYERSQYEKSKKHSRIAFILSVIGILVTIVIVLTLLIIFWPEMPEPQQVPQ